MRLPLYIVKTAGTKSWFVPHALEFLGGWRPKTIVEPFAGSGVVGLSLLHEGCAERLVLAENDKDYLAFWRAALGDSNFCYRVSKWTERVLYLPFEQQQPFVDASLERMKEQDPGFWILLQSRMGYNGKKRGGFMTEKNRGGIQCRWPRTLDASLDLLYSLRNKITVVEDGFEALVAFDSEDSYAFVDPTYTMTKKCPGHKIYAEVAIDHDKLLSMLAIWKGCWQLTYNDSPATREVLTPFVNSMTGNLKQKRLLMSSGSGNGGSKKKWEFVISRVPLASGEGMSDPAKSDWRYWLTPPDLYEKLDAEFHFDFDPCPCPRPEDYDGLVADWGQSTYCNPPFRKKDSLHGGPTAFVRKGISEAQKGKTVVFALPAQSYIGLLIEARAEFRCAGRVRWLEAESKKPCPSPSPIVLAVLRPPGRVQEPKSSE